MPTYRSNSFNVVALPVTPPPDPSASWLAIPATLPASNSHNMLQYLSDPSGLVTATRAVGLTGDTSYSQGAIAYGTSQVSGVRMEADYGTTPWTGNTITVGIGKDHPTLVLAYWAASDGDTILIDPGTYSGPDWWLNRDSTMVGGSRIWGCSKSLRFKSASSFNPVVIDAQNTMHSDLQGAWVLGRDTRANDATLEIELDGIEIINCEDNRGGANLAGVRLAYNPTVVIRNFRFEHCDNGTMGNARTLTLVDGIIRDCGYGGVAVGQSATHGAYVNPQYPGETGSMIVRRVVFDRLAGVGHHLKYRGEFLTVEDCIFGDRSLPTTSSESRCIDMPQQGTLVIDGCTFTQGVNTDNQDVVMCKWAETAYPQHPSHSITVTDSDFWNNAATSTAIDTDTQCVTDGGGNTFTGFATTLTGGYCA